MNLTTHIAKHFRDIHFGGNWTCSNLRDQLKDVTWQQAVTKVDSINTIAALTFHVNYFVGAVLNVMQGNKLDAHDKFSYDHPPITSEHDWQTLQDKCWREAEAMAILIEQLPEEQLWQPFTEEKYGTWYRNLNGIIEHMHYHLGQIAIIKKMVADS